MYIYTYVYKGVDVMYCLYVQIDAVNSHGCTPLHLACHGGCEGVVDLLLQHGASVNPLNNKGQVC